MDRVQAFDYSVDLLTALLWQYNNATNLQGLLQQKQDWYDVNQTEFWQDWYTDVFDLRTANDFGLAVWGTILGQSLYALLPPTLDKPIFGFDTNVGGAFDDSFDDSFDIGSGGEQFYTNFFDGTFGSLDPTPTPLAIAQQRIILRLRYFNLSMRPSVPQINAFMADVFADLGQAYVLDGLDMTATYVLRFVPTSQLLFVLQNFDILPRPAGVKLSTSVVTRKVFGFDPYSTNYFDGNFGE